MAEHNDDTVPQTDPVPESAPAVDPSAFAPEPTTPVSAAAPAPGTVAISKRLLVAGGIGLAVLLIASGAFASGVAVGSRGAALGMRGTVAAGPQFGDGQLGIPQGRGETAPGMGRPQLGGQMPGGRDAMPGGQGMGRPGEDGGMPGGRDDYDDDGDRPGGHHGYPGGTTPTQTPVPRQ